LARDKGVDNELSEFNDVSSRTCDFLNELGDKYVSIEKRKRVQGVLSENHVRKVNTNLFE
jgi:hypothetical protein